MMKSSTIQRAAKKVNYRRIQIYTSLKWERGILKSGSDDTDILIKQNRKSTLTDLQLEKWCESYIFTDESSEFSIESDEILNNATALTSQFRIIPSGIDGNCLFHTLNNIVLEDN